mgnify:CR=1 FL=1
MSSFRTETNVPQIPIAVKLGAPNSDFRCTENNPPNPANSARLINTQLPLLPRTMIHHSNAYPHYIRGNKDIVWRDTSYYGVSTSLRVLSPQLLFKRFNLVRKFLEGTLGLSPAQREVTLRLIRFWAYYGKVYPKEPQICGEPGCSKATFWRTIKHLQDVGLITVIHRFLTPYRRQISNLYRLDKLILLIAKYLAEHGVSLPARWLKPYLQLPWPQLWRVLSVFGGGNQNQLSHPQHPE